MKAVFLSLVVLAAFCMLSRSSAVQAAGVALSTSSSPINRKDTTTSTTPIEDSPPAHPTALSPKSQYLQSRKSLANLVEEVSAFIHEEEGSSQVPRPRKESPPSTLQEPEEAEKKKEEEEIVLGDEDRRPLLKIALRSGRKSLPAPPVFTPHNAEYNHVPMHRVMGKSPLFSPHKSSSEIRLKSHLQYSPPSPPANSVRSRQSLPEITNKIKNGRISLRQRVATVAAVSTPISADQSSGSVPAGDLEDQPITTSFFYNIITMWNKLPSIFKKSKNKKVAEKVVEVLNPVFGGDLDKLMIDGTHVPKILSDCARIILEVGGLETQGKRGDC